MDSVKLREILVEVAQGGAKELAEPEAFECAVNSGHEAIMSALKRGAGVVVSPLVWREHSGPAWVAATPFGQYAIGKLVAGGFTAQFSGGHSVGDFDTLEAAKAACQADFAKRITSTVEPTGGLADGLEQAAALIDAEVEAYIKDHGMYDGTTGHMEYPGNGEEWVADREELAEAIRALKGTAPASAVEPSEELGKILNPDRETAPKTAPVELGAVEPSCVVTDEMVEAAWSAFVGAGEDWRDGAVRRRDDLDKAALKAALTAALSSRTEEEVRADEARKWKLLITGGEDHPGQADTLTLEEAKRLLRARSLTNGGD